VLTLLSKKVSLQNGFGAYTRVTLYCDYDTQAKKVLEYRIDDPIPGWLPSRTPSSAPTPAVDAPPSLDPNPPQQPADSSDQQPQ